MIPLQCTLCNCSRVKGRTRDHTFVVVRVTTAKFVSGRVGLWYQCRCVVNPPCYNDSQAEGSPGAFVLQYQKHNNMHAVCVEYEQRNVFSQAPVFISECPVSAPHLQLSGSIMHVYSVQFVV